MFFFDIPFNSNFLKIAIQKASFESLTKRKRGEENKNSFYHKGIIGDWKNYFDEECIQLFQNAHDNKWNKLLINLCYEKSFNWK